MRLGSPWALLNKHHQPYIELNREGYITVAYADPTILSGLMQTALDQIDR